MTPILGTAVADAEQMSDYLLSVNSKPKINMPVKQFCQLFLDVAAKEGVRGDFLFAQSCKETGNFRFLGTVDVRQNNFAGLGTVNKETPGASFVDEATGILAQAQHAKGYATKDPLNEPCVDSRYELIVKYGLAGTVQFVEDLGGKWAVPGYSTEKYISLDEANRAKDSYGYQITAVLDKIVSMPQKKSLNKIVAIDAGHGMSTPGYRCFKTIDWNQTREWFLNNRIASILQGLLSAYQCTVVRVDDTSGKRDITEKDRVTKANKAKADVYISIHHNAGISGSAGGGTVVYYYSVKADRKTQAQSLYDAVVMKTGLVGNRSTKVKKHGFYVLKHTNMPAFLLQNGFMDSITDTPIILTSEHAEQTAQGILAFLVQHLSLRKREDL